MALPFHGVPALKTLLHDLLLLLRGSIDAWFPARVRQSLRPFENHEGAATRKIKIAQKVRHPSLGTRVWLHWGEGKRPGQLTLDFYEEGQLQAFWDKLMSDWYLVSS